MKNVNSKRLTLAICLLLATFLISGCGPMHRMARRIHHMHGGGLGEMADFGARMMPFGMGREMGKGMHGPRKRGEMPAVSHVFEKSDSGGVYQMIADDAENAETVAWIQDRLSLQADQMQNLAGMVSQGKEGKKTTEQATDETNKRADKQRRSGLMLRGPKFRGMGMAGMGDLLSQMTIEYSELPDGAQIAFSAEEPEVIEMIQAWMAHHIP